MKRLFRTRWRVTKYRGHNNAKYPWRIESRLWWSPFYVDQGGDFTPESAVTGAKRMADIVKIQVI